MKQFVCMKWGSLYGAEYVNRLYAMVRANSFGEIRFVCMTDNVDGIRDEVELMPCPDIALPSSHINRPWRKVSLFGDSARLFGLAGDWLFLDLDLVVTGNLDDFFEYKPEEPFVVMVNWTQPGSGIGNTSCYRFRVGSATELLANLEHDPMPLIKKYTNSQTYISKNIRRKAFWPDDWCALFKVHCLPPWPRRFWMEPTIPQGAHIVAFPGNPNPHEALDGVWPEDQKLKKIYKHVRPTRWIGRVWSDSEAHVVRMGREEKK